MMDPQGVWQWDRVLFVTQWATIEDQEKPWEQTSNTRAFYWFLVTSR